MQVYAKEPELEMSAFIERFNVGKGTLRALFRIVDRRLKRVRAGSKAYWKRKRREAAKLAKLAKNVSGDKNATKRTKT